jgi:hypothetical protein
MHLGGNPLIRTVKTRRPRRDCIACGENRSIGEDLNGVDYEAFCAGVGVEVQGEDEGVERISVKVSLVYGQGSPP